MACFCKSIISIAFFYSVYILGLKVTFERARMEYYNPKYLEQAYVNVTRYSRKSDYYANVEFTAKYAANNNYTFHIYILEFSRNHYKRSFIEFHYKMCDLIMLNEPIGGIVRNAGITCPIPAGHYTLMNVTVNYDHFPNAFPFEKGRIDIYLNASSDGEAIVKVVGYISFKNEIKKQKQG